MNVVPAKTPGYYHLCITEISLPRIGHLQAAPILCFKVSLTANLLIRKWFFYSHANITHFHKNGFALSLIWKWEFLELGNGLLIFLLSVNHPLTVTCWIRFQRHHDNITLWLVKWLAFRLMFCSGIVKLSSRCPTWWGLTALDWHYESQVQLVFIQFWKGLIACIYLGKKFTLFLLIVGHYMHCTTSKKVTVTLVSILET